MIAKIMVVAPHGGADEHRLGGRFEGVPCRVIGFEECLPTLKSGSKPKSFSMSCSIPGIVSVWASSKIDCALSVTGP